MSKLNPEIQKLLDDNGIKQAPKNGVDNIANGRKAFDNMFGNPMKQLDDLFDCFGEIFSQKPFHEDRFKNYKNAKDKEDGKI